VAVAFRFPSVLATREASESRPKLTIVPDSDRRYVRVVAIVGALIVAMFMVVALRAHMAQQQMNYDKLNYDISRARLHFDTLRAQRAALQSPEILISQARQMGLVQSVGTRLVEVPSATAAEIAATVGKVDADVAASEQSPLDEFGRLKATVEGSP
jgi:hypothetical protein